MRRSPLILCLVLLAAGCTAPEEDGPTPASDPSSSDGGGEPAAEASSAGADPPEASPSGPADAPAAPGEAPPSAAPVVTSCDVATAAGPAVPWPLEWVSTAMVPPAQGLFDHACAPGPLTPSGPSFRSAVIEFQWQNAAPITVDLAVYSGEHIVFVSSDASPIRVDLRDDLLLAGPLEFKMEHGGTGAYVDFRGTTWFSAFETDEPPADYTAIP